MTMWLSVNFVPMKAFLRQPKSKASCLALLEELAHRRVETRRTKDSIIMAETFQKVE